MFGTDYLFNSLLHAFVLDKSHRQPESYLHVNYDTGEKKIVNHLTLPEVTLDKIRIVIVGDTHDRHGAIENLPACDLFVHCGDIHMIGRYFSRRDAIEKLKHFNQWLGTIPAKQRIVIGGNHDHHFVTLGKKQLQEILFHANYLENDAMEYRNIRIWGTPISAGKSENTAFQGKEYHEKTMNECPTSTDILITHGPYLEIQSKVKHKLHICGHRHNSYGVQLPPDSPVLSICAPLHDGRFRLKHLPVIVDYPLPSSDTSTSEKLGTSMTAISDANILNRTKEATTLIRNHSIQEQQQHSSLFSFISSFDLFSWRRDRNRKIIPLNDSVSNIETERQS